MIHMLGFLLGCLLAIIYAVVSTELERHRARTARDTYAAHRADIRLFDQDEEGAA